MAKRVDPFRDYKTFPRAPVMDGHTLNRILHAVAPGMYPGWLDRKRALAIFENQVGWTCIINWRKGRRRIPAWAQEKAREALAGKSRQIAQLADVLDS